MSASTHGERSFSPQAEETTLRRATKSELKFIRASWFESYRKGGRAPEVRYNIFRPHQDAIINDILEKAAVWVVTPAAVPDEVCGYVVFTPKTLQYLYVKQDYRKHGLATKLISTFGPFAQYTHETVPGKRLLTRHGAAYNPFLLNDVQPKEAFEWQSST